jgi:hypothetical protein
MRYRWGHSDKNGAHHAPREPKWGRRNKLLAALLGALLAGGTAYGVSNWVVGLGAGSNGEATSGTVSNLTITAVASPSASNLLYPGGNGDVVVSISNPNPFPVTITAVDLPTNTTYAAGYSDSGLLDPQSGCSASTPSYVIWNYSSGTSGSSHTLASPLVVAATGQSNNPLAVTLTDDASMTVSAPAACEATYFSMPSFTGIQAAGGGSPTSSPATDSWSS